MGIQNTTFVDNNPPQCDAEFLNTTRAETNNVIESTGEVLSVGDTSQLGKAVADYSGTADAFNDSGAADAYVLSTIGTLEGPTGYVEDQRVRFRPGNNNTGASTVNVNGLGVKSIKLTDGTDPRADNISANGDVELKYDGTNFVLIDSQVPIDNIIQLFVDVPADQDYLVDNNLNIPYNIYKAIIVTTSGTLDFDLKVNAVSINAFTGVSSTAQTANLSPVDLVANGIKVTGTVTNNSSASQLLLKLFVDGVI